MHINNGSKNVLKPSLVQRHAQLHLTKLWPTQFYATEPKHRQYENISTELQLTKYGLKH